MLAGVAIQASKLFHAVAFYGGFFAVTHSSLWPEVLKSTLNLSGEDEGELSIANDPQVISQTMQLYWTRLYALERVVLFSQPDDGVDYTLVDFEPMLFAPAEPLHGHEEEDSGMTQNSSFSSRPGTRPHTPNTRYIGGKSLDKGLYTENASEEEDDGEDELENRNSTGKRILRVLSQRLKLNPASLMEMFTSRPEHGRPMTWRHNLDAMANEKLLAQDYTKTPLPRSSGRLMGRQREGLLMRRLEQILANGPDTKSRAAALDTLVVRSFNKMFFLALYPMLLDELLRFTQDLISKVAAYTSPAQLHSSKSHLFNSAASAPDSDLNLLTRISIIFRNLANSPSNTNLLASHPGVIAVLSNFASLVAFEPLISSTNGGTSTHRTLSSVQQIGQPWCDNGISTTLDSLNTVTSEGNAKEKENLNASISSPVVPHTIENATSIILRLKSTPMQGHFSEIQFNAMESLSKLISILRLSPSSPSGSLKSSAQSNQSSRAPSKDLSQVGLEIKPCVPAWIEIVIEQSTAKNNFDCGKTNSNDDKLGLNDLSNDNDSRSASGKAHRPNSLVFLAVELLARLSTNPHSRPLWQSIPMKSRSSLIETLVQFAIVNDELSDWSLLACQNLALNALDISLAQSLANNLELIENLMLLGSAYSTPTPSQTPTEQQRMLAYRRHTFAVRAATILHRLVEFVPMRDTLLLHEETIADILLHAPVEISDPFHRVFLEMQSLPAP